MAEPSVQSIKKLFALSGNRCAFPGCSLPMIDQSGVVTGEICHIYAKSKGGPRYKSSLAIAARNDFSNLILLCTHHHKIIDAQPEIYSAETLKELKGVHEAAAGRAEKIEDGFFAQLLLNSYRSISINNNSGNILINSPGSIQGQKVIVNTGKSKVKIEAPQDSLGAHPVYSKYVSHLIARYNQFASKDRGRKAKFSFGAVSTNIEREFGARWQLLGCESANSIILHLQRKIDNTRLARINASKGYPSYSTFEEYIEKYKPKDQI